MSSYSYHDFLALLGIGGAHPGGLTLTKEVLQNEKINQDTHILDAGCGTGQTSAYLAKTFGCLVTAVDRHPLMVKKAQQRFRKDDVRVSIIQDNIENLTFNDESFDLILVESVTVFTNIEKSCGELFRVLKKGGTLFDLEMTAISPFSNEETKEFHKVYEIDKIPTLLEWKSYYLGGGFHSVELIKEKRVAQALNLQPLNTDRELLPEFNPSEHLDPLLYQVWDDHQSLTERFAQKLSYNVYRAQKS